MGQLMAEWDREAEEQGKRRLEPKFLQRAQYLSRHLKKEKGQKKFLPQSYASATILLAIVHPSQLVALPKGLRKQQFFPSANSVPYDLDRFNSEKLSRSKPDVAFVSSHYSHPSTIEALRSQGIPIVFLGSLDRMEKIKEAIQVVGKHAEREEEAELLNLFIDAALLALQINPPQQKIVYATAYTQLTTPSKQTFTYEMLQGLGLEPEKPGIVLDQERLYALNPDKLIVSTHEAKFSVYKDLRAEVRFLDDEVQQAASQFAVLAYYDLVQALR